MTEEKKKAKELIEKYYPYADGYKNYDIDEKYQWKNAKQCALTCVDEIIEAVIDASHKTSGSHNYWLNVKQELNNM